MTDDEMVGWHHQLNGDEFEQTLGDWRTEEPGVPQSLGSQRVRHDLVTKPPPPPKIKRKEILISVNVLKSTKMVYKDLSLLPRKCFNCLSPQICCCCSVTHSCPTPCDTMDCSRPGLPAPHRFPKSIQIHVHCIGDAIQPSHPLMLSSPSALNLYQHQGLFQ